MARYTKAEQAESVARLREMLPKGATVYGIVRSVAKSGMSRRIDFYTIDATGDRPSLLWLTGLMAKALDLGRPNGRDGIRVYGCGMDMIFATVYELSSALYSGEKGAKSKGGKGPGYFLRSEHL